ncbi:hypothetical protein LCGC14_0263150 [marine sediment metagenome]|uniref:Fibronectin type-III domain-containing protein n=1 Tax=marine sediment metagenome TaxID=412755 RepID=A0A0F9U1C7_9ZZZZ
MAEVRLRKDFNGTQIPKTSADYLRISISFSYKGPAQTLAIETNTGKRGVWGDYDQESPAYQDSKPVSQSETLRSYSFSRNIPLSFWGDRQIDDCAVEVVIRGEGVYADAVIWDAYTVNLGAPPSGKEAPQIQTLPAANILHNSATLIVELTKVGFCNVIDCYIEWGRTTTYGFKSPERRLYPYPDPRAQLHVDIAGLQPGTTYHFRAVAVGRCVTPALTGYGANMTFTTKTEVAVGFTLRMLNAPPEARFWSASYVAGGDLPGVWDLPIDEVWTSSKPVPNYEGNFWLTCQEQSGPGPYLKYTELINVRFRDGKNYAFDWSRPAWDMRIEEI